MGYPIIKTSAYWNRLVGTYVKDGDAIAVGITRYKPKFALGYSVHSYLKELAPTSGLLYGSKSQQFFEKLFIAELETNWAIAESKLIELSLAVPEKDIILLCYENVYKKPQSDNWCHRTMVSRYIAEKWGLEIEELEVKTTSTTRKENKTQIEEEENVQLRMC